jgi:PHD/YefM family antitoxin component YafN of YafNO toxin-antitoxin module
MLPLTPFTETVTNLKNNPLAVLERAGHNPLFLLQHSKPILVLLSTQRWNELVLRLEELERRELIRQRAAEASAETDVTLEEFMQGLN